MPEPQANRVNKNQEPDLCGCGISQPHGCVDSIVKAVPILGQNYSPLDEAAHNRTRPGMNQQFGSDEDRKGYKKSDVYFNVVKEGKPTDASSPGTLDGGEEQQWQPCDHRDNKQSAM